MRSMTERNREHGRRRKGCGRPHVVPERPTSDVARPQAGTLGTRRVNGRQGFISRHVEYDRHQNRAEKIEQAAEWRTKLRDDAR